MLQPTPASDLSILKALPADSLAEIARLLKQSRIRKSTLKVSVPDEFLRSLFIYVRVLNNPETPQSMVEDLVDVGDWFESNFPLLMEEPGFESFLKYAERAMEDYQLVPREDPTTDLMKKALLTSVGNITGFTCQPALSGPSLIPTLRVFLFHDDTVLLDSTGDWDEWLQLIKNLLASLEGQARNLSDYIEIGQVIEGSLSDQIDEIEQHIKSLKRFLREHAAPTESSQVKGRGAKSK